MSKIILFCCAVIALPIFAMEEETEKNPHKTIIALTLKDGASEKQCDRENKEVANVVGCLKMWFESIKEARPGTDLFPFVLKDKSAQYPVTIVLNLVRRWRNERHLSDESIWHTNLARALIGVIKSNNHRRSWLFDDSHMPMIGVQDLLRHCPHPIHPYEIRTVLFVGK